MSPLTLGLPSYATSKTRLPQVGHFASTCVVLAGMLCIASVLRLIEMCCTMCVYIHVYIYIYSIHMLYTQYILSITYMHHMAFALS